MAEADGVHRSPGWQVIGIGNPDRGDDGVGGEVVRRLDGSLPTGIGLMHEPGAAIAVLHRLQDAERTILIDAARSGAAPGTVHRLDAASGALPGEITPVSSHGLGLAQALELARTLALLPPRCIVFAIEGERFDAGAPLTPAVERAAASVAEQILREVASLVGDESFK